MSDIGLVDEFFDGWKYLDTNTLRANQLVFDPLHISPGASHLSVMALNPEMNNETPIGCLIRDLNGVAIVEISLVAEVRLVALVTDHGLFGRDTHLPFAESLARQLLQLLNSLPLGH